MGDWIESAAGVFGLEAVPVEATYSTIGEQIGNCAPAVLRLKLDGTEFWLAIVKGGRGRVQILTPGIERAWVGLKTIGAALRRPLEEPLIDEIESLVIDAGISNGPNRERAIDAILHERLGGASIPGCWLLRASAKSALRQQIRESGLLPEAAKFVTAHVADVLFLIAIWWLIGRAILQGRLDYGWLAAWTLLLITRIPLGLLIVYFQGRVALTAGTIVKRRLLAGSLSLRPEEVRRKGVGQLLGQVIESEALESLALGGGMSGVMAIVEIAFAIAILAGGAGQPWLGSLLALWFVVAVLLSWRYIKTRKGWTEARLGITHDLVERMAGHRTRIAQEDPEKWHEQEDEEVRRYADLSRAMDRRQAFLAASIPRGWLILSLLCLAPTVMSGNADPTRTAVALGGMLLALGALKTLARSLTYLGSAAIAWRQVKPLFEAAARAEVKGLPDFAIPRASAEFTAAPAAALLGMHDVSFAHDGRSEKVLDRCNLQIFRGDHIRLEGPSGGGKSTLAWLLTSLRTPQSGLVLLEGLDLHTLGTKTWRRKVAAASQFHENHIFTGSLAFNLLMGRRWPPRAGDLKEAETVLCELGLGDLLDRMPAGLFQQVGETGWQLSLGERSRIFLARALLQASEVVILDESFGSLDPDTLRNSMQCVKNRAETLVVIAHP